MPRLYRQFFEETFFTGSDDTTMDRYINLFKKNLSELERAEKTLKIPKLITGYLFLTRTNLTEREKTMILSQCNNNYDFEDVEEYIAAIRFRAQNGKFQSERPSASRRDQ